MFMFSFAGSWRLEVMLEVVTLKLDGAVVKHDKCFRAYLQTVFVDLIVYITSNELSLSVP